MKTVSSKGYLFLVINGTIHRVLQPLCFNIWVKMFEFERMIIIRIVRVRVRG